MRAQVVPDGEYASPNATSVDRYMQIDCGGCVLTEEQPLRQVRGQNLAAKQEWATDVSEGQKFTFWKRGKVAQLTHADHDVDDRL